MEPYEEGLAMRFEHIIMGRETWHEQKGQNEWLNGVMRINHG